MSSGENVRGIIVQCLPLQFSKGLVGWRQAIRLAPPFPALAGHVRNLEDSLFRYSLCYCETITCKEIWWHTQQEQILDDHPVHPDMIGGPEFWIQMDSRANHLSVFRARGDELPDILTGPVWAQSLPPVTTVVGLESLAVISDLTRVRPQLTTPWMDTVTT